MFSSVVRFFYPDIKKEEVKKFGLLALSLFFILGSYWILRLLKDVLVYKMAFPAGMGWELFGMNAGKDLVSRLKMISPFVVISAVAVYTKLVDMFDKRKLFNVILSFYVGFFSLMLAFVVGLSAFGPEFFGKYLVVGICSLDYLITETFGSMVIAMFWSFTLSSTKSDEAKRGFPFMIAVAQIGTIGGSTLVKFSFANWFLFSLCLCSLVGAIMAINYLVRSIPADQMVSDKVETKKSKPDFFAGIKLLTSKPYLMGVFVVSTFYEVAKTIVDFQMKTQGTMVYGADQFKSFLGTYGMAVNGLAFLMALLGTSKLMKKYGLRFCLILYPAMFAASLIGLYFYYQTSPDPANLLWATFAVMMLVTATSYAVNNPTKEMMYIPTSKDTKFKAKGFTDMIGGRSAKMTGASINNWLNVPGNSALTVASIMGMGTLIGLGVVGAWLVAAVFVGQKNAQLTRDGEIIE